MHTKKTVMIGYGMMVWSIAITILVAMHMSSLPQGVLGAPTPNIRLTADISDEHGVASTGAGTVKDDGGEVIQTSTEAEDFQFDPSHPLLASGTTHTYRYRTRTLTTPHEGASSAGVELTCVVHFEVEPGEDHDAIVTMRLTQPHVYRIGNAIPKEKG